MLMADIYKHLKSGISSLLGGTTRMDFRYSTPRMADALHGINDFKWGWLDPVSGKRCDCTDPINGTLPYDRHGDVIFIVDIQKIRNDCFVLWYDKTNEVVFLDIGGPIYPWLH